MKKKSKGKRTRTSQQSRSPIRILIWSANPYVITGFGQVMKHILSRLFRNYPGQYEILQMGINFSGDYVDEFDITGGPQNGRFRMWPAVTPSSGNSTAAMFGHDRFLQLAYSINVDYDVIFLAEDPFWLGGTIPTDPSTNRRIFIDEIRKVLISRNRGHVPIVGYFPIDGVPDPEWLINLEKYDVSLTYLPFGVEEIKRKNKEFSEKVGIMPLGVDPKEFHLLPPEKVRSFKASYFGANNVSKYLVLNCNRNQPRKFLPSNLLAFKAFQEKYSDSIMYLHMKEKELIGWDLPRVCRNIGLEVGKDVFFPDNFSVTSGVAVEELNCIFNAADMLTTTALGGGWELAVTQAYATDTVVVAPNNTSHSNLCADGRGVLYASGNRLALKAVLKGDNEVVRPLPDLDDMVEKMFWVRENPEEVKKIKARAAEWTKEKLCWDKIVKEWHRIFSECRDLKKRREALIYQK